MPPHDSYPNLKMPHALRSVADAHLAFRRAEALRRAVGSNPYAPTLTASSAPWLRDHVVGGAAVIPMAMALEWFAQTLAPGRGVRLVLSGFQTLRSARVGDGPEDARLSVRAHDAHIELRDRHERSLFRAQEVGGPVARQAFEGIGGEPWGADPIYDGCVLFHGPAWRCIRRIDRVGPDGISAVLRGARALGWACEGLHTDPTLTDGVFQLAARWSARALGGAWLPMAVQRVALWQQGVCADEARVVLRVRAQSASQLRFDAWLFEPDGLLRAEFAGVEMIRRPDV